MAGMGMPKGYVKAGANVMYKGKRYRVMCREHWGGAEIFLRLAGPHGTIAARMEDCVRLNGRGVEDNGEVRLDIGRDQAPGGTAQGIGSGGGEADPTQGVGEGGEGEGETGTEGETSGTVEGVQQRKIASYPMCYACSHAPHPRLRKIELANIGTDDSPYNRWVHIDSRFTFCSLTGGGGETDPSNTDECHPDMVQ